MRLIRLVFVCALLSLVAPVTAMAAERMWVGFQDDPSFRWRVDRASTLDEAVKSNAGIVRTTVYWSRIAPFRPASPSNPFDPAYRWDDLDEFVRSAQFRGLETLLTIWGTPNWANGSKGANYMPTRLADITAFARALASRYSGRNPGYPYVRFYSVWNEPNLEQFLAPTFNSKGQARGAVQLREALPSRLRRPEGRQPGGRRRHRRDVAARTRQALAGQDPGLDGSGDVRTAALDSAATRAVPGVPPPPVLGPRRRPMQKGRYPNVHLTQLGQFSHDLNKWFKKSVNVWITEYGFETKPGEPRGVTPAQQAAYAAQTMAYLRGLPTVKMFIWFIFETTPRAHGKAGS